MKWSPVKKNEIEQLVRFLKTREWECMNLLHRLLLKGRPFFPDPNHAALYALRGPSSDFGGVVYVSKNGLLLPYVPASAEDLDFESLSAFLRDRSEYFQSIVGTERSVSLTSGGLGLTPAVDIPYHLMRIVDADPSFSALEIPEITVRSARLSDAEALLPLQEGYEREEVLVKQEFFDPEKTLKDLKTALSTQIVFLAEYRGKPVAKGGTNARGIAYDQIGGIYTKPEFRNRKICRLLMQEILGNLKLEGKRGCLFVKKSNLPAQSVYKRLGFKMVGDFHISYFNI